MSGKKLAFAVFAVVLGAGAIYFATKQQKATEPSEAAQKEPAGNPQGQIPNAQHAQGNPQGQIPNAQHVPGNPQGQIPNAQNGAQPTPQQLAAAANAANSPELQKMNALQAEIAKMSDEDIDKAMEAIKEKVRQANITQDKNFDLKNNPEAKEMLLRMGLMRVEKAKRSQKLAAEKQGG